MGLMLKYLQRSDIDDQRWNEAMDACPNRMIYGYTWYLDAVTENWSALATDDYSAIMPLPFNRKYFISYVFTPPYCQQLGVFSTRPVDEVLLNAFLNSMPDQFKYADYNLNWGNAGFSVPFTRSVNKNLVLSLGGSYDEIASKFSNNHRRNIRKAVESGLILEETHDIDPVVRMFESGRGNRMKSNPDHDYRIIRSMSSKMRQLGKTKILLAKSDKGALLGGAMFLLHGNGAYFIFSGVSATGRKCSVMHFIVSKFIQSNGSELSFLDFEGSNDPELARFYSGFGADESLYLRIVINKLPILVRWLKR